jgi:phosphoribosylamine--glycine ligase
MTPKRILIMGKEGDGFGVGQRLALEGNAVDVWCADERFSRALDGIVGRPTDWRAAAKAADLIVIDCVGLARIAPELTALGKPILGCSPILDKIELDRGAGMRLFRTAGIAIPETFEFKSTADADKIVKEVEWQTGFVIKPNGNISTAKTMIVKDQTQWARSLSNISPDSTGILQRVVSGIEVSTEGWFNGRRFLRPFNHTFEEKRFLAGGLGVNTGCMGNVVINGGASNALTKNTVERLSDFLAHIDYRGPFDINCIVTKDTAYALEATSRMGYDAVEALAEGLEEPLGQLLIDVAEGAERDIALTTDTMIAVRLSIPPWPVRKPEKDAEPEPVSGIDDSTLPHLFLTDIRREGDTYETAGGDGVLLKATAVGSVRSGGERSADYTYEARRRVYRLLDRIGVAGKQYRTDVGQRVNSELAQLKEWGWL